MQQGNSWTKWFQDNSTAYENAFSYSNEKSIQEELYIALFTQQIKKNNYKYFNILDVGCCIGSMMSRIVHQISKEFPKLELNLFGIDPAPNVTFQYKKNIIEANLENTLINVNVEEIDFVSFAAKAKEDKWDLILFDHCLYDFSSDHRIEVYNFITHFLSEKGLALISLASEFSPVSLIRASLYNNNVVGSESIWGELREQSYEIGKVRYLSNFICDTSEKIGAITKWVKLDNNNNDSEFKGYFSDIDDNVSETKKGIYNVADIILVRKLTIKNSKWASLAKRSGILSKKSFFDSLEEGLENHVRLEKDISAWFNILEGGYLIFGAMGQNILARANSSNVLMAPNHRAGTDIVFDLKRNLSLKVDNDEGLNLKGSIDTYSSKISSLTRSSKKSHLADELENLNPPTHYEEKLTFRIISPGEYSLTILLGLFSELNIDEDSFEEAKNIIAAVHFAVPGTISDHSFFPSYRFFSFVNWLRELIRLDMDTDERDKLLPKSILDVLEDSRVKENITSLIDCKILSDTEKKCNVYISDFVAFLNALKNSILLEVDDEFLFQPRSVPKINRLVAKGIWAEAPSLIIFDCAEYKTEKIFGFLTLLDTSGKPELTTADLNIKWIGEIAQLVSWCRLIYTQSAVIDLSEKYPTSFINDVYELINPDSKSEKTFSYFNLLKKMNTMAIKILGSKWELLIASQNKEAIKLLAENLANLWFESVSKIDIKDEREEISSFSIKNGNKRIYFIVKKEEFTSQLTAIPISDSEKVIVFCIFEELNEKFYKQYGLALRNRLSQNPMISALALSDLFRSSKLDDLCNASEATTKQTIILYIYEELKESLVKAYKSEKKEVVFSLSSNESAKLVISCIEQQVQDMNIYLQENSSSQDYIKLPELLKEKNITFNDLDNLNKLLKTWEEVNSNEE